MLLTLPCLNITYSWCQENGKESLGEAIREEILEENRVKEKKTGKQMSGEAPRGTQGAVTIAT